MRKIDRAQIILGQILSMDRSGGVTMQGDSVPNLIIRKIEVKQRWEGAVMCGRLRFCKV